MQRWCSAGSMSDDVRMVCSLSDMRHTPDRLLKNHIDKSVVHEIAIEREEMQAQKTLCTN